MAKEKARSNDATEKMSDEDVQDFLDGLPQEQQTALAPVVKNLPAPVVERLGDLLEEMSSNQTGLEEMDSAWTPPIIKVRQGMTTDAPKNVQLGQMFTAEGEVFGDSFEFAPIYMHPAHLKFEQGDSTPSCSSMDGKTSIYGDVCKDCPDEPFKHGEPTDCSKYRYVFVFNKDFTRIYKLTLGKTSYKAGTKLQRYWKGSAKTPWNKLYSLETKEMDRKGGGTYYVFNIVPTGESVTDENFLSVGQFFYERIKESRMAALEDLKNRQAHAQQGGGQATSLESEATPATKAAEPDFGSDGTL